MMRLKKININNLNLKMRRVLIAIVLLMSFTAGYMMFSDSGKQQDTNDNSQKKDEVPMKSAQINDTEGINTAIGNIYPFSYDENSSDENTVLKNNNSGGHAILQNQARNLPAIPNYSNQNFPMPVFKPMPQTQSPQNTSTVVAAPQVVNTIQGILTDDNGAGIAIMADGNVLQSGEQLAGSRIQYIDSSGIVLENGNKISYDLGEAK